MNACRLRRADAARYCRERGYPVANSTLAKLAVVGGGPTFVKFGRIPLYAPDDLESWLAKKTSKQCKSTSQVEG
jgi:hypothetical protein